ncbi:MAG: hypothetical protein ACE5Q6_26975 [Dehalococcoidia bacterium]
MGPDPVAICQDWTRHRVSGWPTAQAATDGTDRSGKTFAADPERRRRPNGD